MGTITDDQGKVIATVDVTEYEPGRFEGSVLSSEFPDLLRLLLGEFESCANDQCLSVLDEIEAKIDRYHLIFTNRNGRIFSLQLWEPNVIRFRVNAETNPQELG